MARREDRFLAMLIARTPAPTATNAMTIGMAMVQNVPRPITITPKCNKAVPSTGERSIVQMPASSASPKTPALLKKAVEGHAGQVIVLSFDNDEQGKEYTAGAMALLGELAKQSDKELRVRTPAHLKDWNEQLVNEREKVSCQKR